MERNIPRDASEAIDFFLQTVYSVLKSRNETRVSSFEEAHAAMDSTMHHAARAKEPDFNALIYTILRLPPCMINVHRVILGQNSRVFKQAGYKDISEWKEVGARARRRVCQFNGTDTLACFITSRSDIDDLIPELTAFQIEWNKFHELLRNVPEDLLNTDSLNDPAKCTRLTDELYSPKEDLFRLYKIWGEDMWAWLLEMKKRPSEMRVRLLDSSLVQYTRSASTWLNNILEKCPELADKPLYLISSNPHSVINLLSGYALQKESELIAFLKEPENESFKQEWEQIESGDLSASRENLLYYILKKYQSTSEGAYTIEEQHEYERAHGIIRIPSTHSFDIEAETIELSKLDFNAVDPRIKSPHFEKLATSKAMILNFDYPLGMTAYNVLSKLSEQFININGIYIMGKAASLNGIYGDVIIPSVVHDMHSENTYLFSNAFTGSDLEPFLKYGSVLGNQKAVTVFGTFLQNQHFMEALYRGGYTDIEMEAGPYLSAIYEMFRPQRHPTDEIVDLFNMKLDIGILHYVSDTPMSKGKNLGAGTLSYFGMDSTYATSIAIARRIIGRETEWLDEHQRNAYEIE